MSYEISGRKSYTFGSDAFTLTELLSVVAIAGVLLALLFPFGVKTLSNAKEVSGLAELRKLGAVHSLYMADHNQEAMPGHNPDSNYVWFYHLIRPYLELPMDNVTAAKAIISPLDPDAGVVPGAAPIHYRSYAVNRRILKSNLKPVRMNELSDMSRMFWLINFDISKRNSNWFEPENTASIAAVPEDWISNERVQLLFLDGRAETLKKKDILPGGERDEVLGPKL